MKIVTGPSEFRSRFFFGLSAAPSCEFSSMSFAIPAISASLNLGSKRRIVAATASAGADGGFSDGAGEGIAPFAAGVAAAARASLRASASAALVAATVVINCLRFLMSQSLSALNVRPGPSARPKPPGSMKGTYCKQVGRRQVWAVN